MTAPVQSLPPIIRPENILTGLPVGSTEWANLAKLANYVNGRGSQIIPHCWVGSTLLKSATDTFNFYCAQKKQAVERVWQINVLGLDNTANIVEVVVNGTLLDTVYVGGVSPIDNRSRATIVAREPLSVQSDIAGPVSVTINNTGGGSVFIETIGCYEQTRQSLAQNSIDNGVDLASCFELEPIIDGTTYRSVPGVCTAYKELDARRTGHFHWCPGEADPYTQISDEPVNLFTLDPNVLPAKANVNDAEVDLECWIYAKMDSLDEAYVYFNGAEIAFDGTSYGWFSVTISQPCEKLSSEQASPDTGWPTVKVETQVSSLGDTMSIAAISIIRKPKPI